MLSQINKKLHTKYFKLTVKITIILIGILLAFFGNDMWTTASQEQQNALDPYSGQLTPYYKIDPTQPITVEFGGAINNYTAQELAQGINLADHALVIQTQNGTMRFPISIIFGLDNTIQITAQIYDKNGNLITNIVENNWQAPKVESNEIKIKDKNYNSYAFEVLDTNGIPLLQVIMGAKNEIRIGYSLYNQGIPIYALLPIGFCMNADPSPTYLQMLRNATIFVYPSEDHLGELKSIPDWARGYPIQTVYPENSPLTDINNKKIVGLLMYIGGAFIGAVVTVDIGAEFLKTKLKKGQSGSL